MSFADCACHHGYHKTHSNQCVQNAPVHVPRPPVPTPYVPIHYNPPVKAPSPVAPLPIEEQNTEVTCVAVIDENGGGNSDSSIEAQWTEFREKYPNRPFCLLRAPSVTALRVPNGFPFASDIFTEVTRDGNDRNVATRSNWFNLCNMASSRARGLTNVVLFVDNSGSMTTRSVQGAHDDFQADIIANGMKVVDAVYNNRENYIEPCLSTSLVIPPV